MKLYKDVNNEVFAYELDGSQDHLIGDKIAITEEELNEINLAKQEKLFSSFDYAKKRQIEYPSFADQLDTIFHDGLDAWKEQIQAVKDKYPKA